MDLHRLPGQKTTFSERDAGRTFIVAECGVAARSAIEAAGWSDADYECGLNCKPWSEAAQAGFDLLVCEDTVGPSLFDP